MKLRRTAADPPDRRTWRHGALLSGIVGVAIFVYVSGYSGIVHDARLYAFQALARLYPADLAGDIFLRFGSQERYSLFSLLYAPLTDMLGVPGAALAVALVSLLALFATTWALLVPWRGAAAATAGTLAVATWPVGYGAEWVFWVAEPFATPRPLAAGIALFSLAMVVRGRSVSALAVLGVALLIHPLMALPALAVGILVLFRPARAAVFASMLCVTLLAGAWAGVPVLEQLVHPMDAEWRAVVLQRSPFLSPLHWSPGDWSLAGVAALSPLLVSLRLDGALRRLYVAAGVVGTIGVAVTLVGSDLAGSALVMQVQPWRALWLSHWLGVAGIGLLLARYDTHRNRADVIALLGLIGAELSAANTGVVVLVVALWATWVLGRPTQGHLSRMALVATLVMAGQAVLWYFAGLSSTLAFAELEMATESIVSPVLRNPALVGALLIAGFLARNVVPGTMLRVAPMLGLAILVTVGTMSVQRAVSADVGQMRSVADSASIARALPRGGSVLWGETGWVAWFVLRYPSYISIMQTAGTVFSRETAIEASRRARHVEAVLGEQMMMRWRVKEMPNKPIDAIAVVKLCADPVLSAVYVPGTVAIPASRPVHNQHGVLTGHLALCSGVQ